MRKRVIKILRDICIEYPAHEKIPDICVKMIRRVNDEEGIQKLVMDVFMTMWFTPCNDNDKVWGSIQMAHFFFFFWHNNRRSKVLSIPYIHTHTFQ